MKAPVTYAIIAAVFALFMLTTCSKLERAVVQSAPDAPSAPSPADGDALDNLDVELTWTCSDPDGDPLTYDIYLDTSSTPEALVATIDTNSFMPEILRYDNTYYWQVVASDTSGRETAGPIWSFSLGADAIAPSCSLMAPNGGELWYVDTEHDIEWQSSDDDSIAFTRLEYSLDNGDTWLGIDSVDGNPQTYSWTIPDSIYSTRCLVRVSAQDFGDNAASDTSDAIFTVWPSGGVIAFSSDREGDFDIFTMFSDGSNQRNISMNVSGSDYYPSWSPDGSQITFFSNRDGNTEIYVMNSDGSGQVNISNNPGTGDEFPSWSPDGDKIAFSSLRTGNWEIYIMNTDGTEQYNLTVNGAADYTCNWDPDGDWLVFTTNRDGGNFDIYKMDESGGNLARLTTHGAWDAYPSWSPPTGLQIAFVSTRDGNYEIYVMNADGSNQDNVSNHSSQDFFPQWSPDGDKIIFSSDRSGNYEIYMINPDGTGLQNVTNSPSSNEYYGSWSPID